MIGHSLGGDRRDRDGRVRAGDRARRRAADGQLGEPRPRVRPRLRARKVARRSAIDAVLSTGSGFGGFQSAMVFARPKELQEVSSMRRSLASMPTRSRVVITGIGVVAPDGIGTEAWWQATLAGKSGDRPHHALRPRRSTRRSSPARSTASTPTDYIDQRLIVQTDRWTLDGAGRHADGAGRRRASTRRSRTRTRMSVITASASGGNEFGQREIQNLWGKGPSFVGAYQSIAWFYAATTGQISIQHGMKGPCGVVVAGGRRRPGRALARAARRSGAASTSVVSRRHRGADRAVRADLPADATGG